MGVLETFIGWLAPSVCLVCGQEGASLCTPCSALNIVPFGERCFNCAALSARARTCSSCRSLGSPRFVWVTTDYKDLAKEVVHVYKFGHQRIAAASIADLMAETLLSFNSDEDIAKANYTVIAVPTATSRVRQRGFDHSALLARTIARKLGLPYANIMKRLGQDRQVGRTRAERFRQVDGKYIVASPEKITGRNILLIDDVVTTGATLTAAAKALRAAGAKRVDALVFAKRL